MCTVIYIPTSTGFLAASCRDEALNREPALMPASIQVGTYSILQPIDGRFGGSWIAARNDGMVMILFNGAFENHQHQPPYAKSRGLIFTQLQNEQNPANAFLQLNLTGIEPFSIIIIQQQALYRLVWDGSKHWQLPLQNIPHIWSSATLYTTPQIVERAKAFAEWLSEKTNSQKSLLHWLQTTLPNENEHRFIMKRSSMATVSVSILEVHAHQIQFNYYPVYQQQLQPPFCSHLLINAYAEKPATPLV
jgi:uncharacterized protein with NRDE domain